MFEDIEIIKWLYGIIIAPFVALAGIAIRNWSRRKRRKESIIKFLSGLPPECKAVLIEFYENGTHTMRGDPLAPPMKILIRQSVITIGSGGGTYDAIDRYLSIPLHIWEVMDDWVVMDIFANKQIMSNLAKEQLEMSTKRSNSCRS